MQAPPSPEHVHVVADEAAAQVLLGAEARRWFAPFLARTSSVSAAAKLLGEKPNSVLYRVKRWRELGLLEVQREEARRGRTLKLYRSVADAFFVPHGVSSSETLVELLHHTNAPYLDTLYRGLVSAARTLSPDWGVQVFRSGTEVKIGAAFSARQSLRPVGQPESRCARAVHSPSARLRGRKSVSARASRSFGEVWTKARCSALFKLLSAGTAGAIK